MEHRRRIRNNKFSLMVRFLFLQPALIIYERERGQWFTLNWIIKSAKGKIFWCLLFFVKKYYFSICREKLSDKSNWFSFLTQFLWTNLRIIAWSHFWLCSEHFCVALSSIRWTATDCTLKLSKLYFQSLSE